MKKSFAFIAFHLYLLVFGNFLKIEANERVEIDRGMFLVAGSTSQTIICKSELERPSIDGRKLTSEQLIHQELARQEVERMKIPIADAAQKHIQTLKKEHGLTDQQVDNIFQQGGRTREEGLRELTRVYAANNLQDMKINSRVVVPHEEVEKYYEENPLYDDKEYQIQTALILPDSNKTLSDMKKEIEEQIKLDGGKSLPWREPIWLKEEDIADERLFITQMKVGQISELLPAYGGFEVIRLVQIKAPQLVPLDRRYKSIVTVLRMPQIEKLKKTYDEELRKSSCVIPLSPPKI